MVRPGKKVTHKRPRIEGVLPGPLKLQGPVPEPNSASCNGQLNSGSLLKQTRRNSLGRDVCSPGCLNVMADILSRLNQGQSTEWSLHPQVFKQICQMWFTPHTCRLICHSSEPQPSTVRISCPRPKCLGHRCSEHKLDGSHCLRLPSDGSPSQGDPKIRQCYCLIIVIAPGWPGMPWFWDLVQLSTEIPLQLPVSTTLLEQSHNYVFHSISTSTPGV